MFPLFVPFAARRAATRGFVCCAVLLVITAVGPSRVQAQELQHQRHPLSTYLDLRPVTPGSPAQSTPAWIEALEYVPAAQPAVIPEAVEDRIVSPAARGKSTFRIRLQRPEGSTAENLQARVFFDDLAAAERPTLTVWSELGERVVATVKLGQNLGLPSSETLVLPMRGANYLEIEADGDGSQVRGLFLSWLEPTEVLQPSDDAAKETTRQPFRILSAARKPKNDSYLYGVVTASLYTGKPLVLKPNDPPAPSLQFELERQPLVAVVSCEVLGASVDAPPTLSVNGHPAGALTFYLPDLADPGYQGVAREDDAQFGFRYTGWLHAQRVVSGAELVAGLNNLNVGLSNGKDALAVRSVSIQLKYNWEKLDYVLVPAPAPVAP